MTQEEIIKGNKLIAKFMGKDISAIIPDRFDISTPYHDDWGWLMPVVDKIEKDHNCIIIDGTSCHIDSNDGQYSETNCCTMNNRFEADKETESKIESTWLAVVEFINWYNKSKKL